MLNESVGPAAPDRPPESLVVKGASAFLCAGVDGDVRGARAAGEGLYWSDTRMLSELHVTLNGVTPRPLSHSNERGFSAVHLAVNPEMVDLTGATIPDSALTLKRR